MILHLYAVVTPRQESVVEKVQGELKNRYARDVLFAGCAGVFPGELHGVPCHGGSYRREAEDFLHWLNNDPDGGDGEYWAYGFNTRMAIPELYYFRLDF